MEAIAITVIGGVFGLLTIFVQARVRRENSDQHQASQNAITTLTEAITNNTSSITALDEKFDHHITWHMEHTPVVTHAPHATRAPRRKTA